MTKEFKQAHNSIETFFNNKSWYCGGPIPKNLLFHKENYKVVSKISFSTAIDIAYRSMDKAKYLARTKKEKKFDIKLVLKTIYECHKLNIKQEHIGGILLIYLQLCEKVELH